MSDGLYRPASMVSYPQFGRDAAAETSSIRPDFDHPLILVEPLRPNPAFIEPLRQSPDPLPALSLEKAFTATANAFQDRLLSRPAQLPAPAAAPTFRFDPLHIPALGDANIVGTRLTFPQGLGSHFEFRVDRPAAAFVMRF